MYRKQEKKRYWERENKNNVISRVMCIGVVSLLVFGKLKEENKNCYNKQKKLCGLSSQANYTGRATAACR
jgi:hypothetical protein